MKSKIDKRKISVRKYTVNQVDQDMIDKMRRATLGSCGIMRSRLNYIKRLHELNDPVPHTIFYSKVDDNFVGWGFLFKEYRSWEFHCYVHKKYRNRGIGTKIMTRAAKFAKQNIKTKTIHVFPHDNAAAGLYKNKSRINLRLC